MHHANAASEESPSFEHTDLLNLRGFDAVGVSAAVTAPSAVAQGCMHTCLPSVATSALPQQPFMTANVALGVKSKSCAERNLLN